MDPRNQEKSLEKLQSKVIFSDPAYAFVFKKTEKIVAALYLITNHISDMEPIKWRIRKISLGLLSDVLAPKRFKDLSVIISEGISLLKIAAATEHISALNCSIVQKELALLMENLHGLQGATIGVGTPVLSHDFFNVPMPAISPVFSPKGQYRTSSDIKDNQAIRGSKDNLKDIKNGRRDKVITLLKAGKPLGIKDFVREIKGYSEKTIQRELLSMVENGVLKKIGERRWSLYSLA